MAGTNGRPYVQAAWTAALLLVSACMDRLPSAPSEVTSGVTVYEHANFRGTSALVGRDASSLSDFSGPCEHSSYSPNGDSTVYDWSDCISSLKVAPGWRARIYVDHDFKGEWPEVSGDVPNLQLVRGSVSRTSPVEEFVWRVGNDLGLLVVAHAPEGDDERPGVLARNRRLIATSTDGLFAFFKEDSFMNGGTGMVVEAAYEQGRMVEAYSVRPDGSVEMSGSAAGTRGFWSSSLSFSL